ncbi:DUF309 domain-containing protein [Bacillaceae bacterium S4-13-56]
MYDSAYIDYLAHLHGTRDYFECHELLEERWKRDLPLKKDAILVGFIQYAVSLYHYRRNNYEGAIRTLEKAMTIFSEKESEIQEYGIDSPHFQRKLTELFQTMKAKKPYKSINIPLSDPILIEKVKKRCLELNCTFGDQSNLQDKLLVHKHKKRDRTEVIQERLQSLQKKTKAK